MTDYIWPSTLIPARSSITLRDLSSRFVSPFTGASRTYSRPGGDLLQMRMDLPPLTAAKGAALRGMVSKLRGGVHRVWCKDHSYVKRGSFPATELLQNNTFSSGTTGWTPRYGTQAVVDSTLRVTVGVHSAGEDPASSAGFATVSGVTYAVRAAFKDAFTSTSIQYGIYTASGAGVGTIYGTSGGLRVTSVTSTTTSAEVSLLIFAAASVGDTFDVTYTSAARCALVKGASQTGARILIDALPTSTDGLLLEGDQVQIGEELFIVAAPLNSNSSGEGHLTLHRPVRTAPSDNAPVIIHEPMGLFMLAESENGWENVPGRFTNASVSLIEAVR